MCTGNNALCGICGNYNGDANDDLKTSTGEDVNGLARGERNWRIGNSYQLEDDWERYEVSWSSH